MIWTMEKINTNVKQDILRSLAKTVLVRLLAKKQVLDYKSKK